MKSHVQANFSGELDWDGVPNVSHGVRSRSKKLIVIWECLNARTFSDSHIAELLIVKPNHGFTTTYAMDPGFNGLTRAINL